MRKPRGALIHAPLSDTSAPPKQDHIQKDGHQPIRRNPASVQQPCHMCVLGTELPLYRLTTRYQQYLFYQQVSEILKSRYIVFTIFLRSISLSKNDIRPPENSSVSARIRSRMNNRLGAVYSAMYNFWSARQAAVGHQRDTNTIILHAEDTQSICENDSTRSPIELLDLLLPNAPKEGNCFINTADTTILKWWDDARPLVFIFLSDGNAFICDRVVQKLFRQTAQKWCVVLNSTPDIKLMLRIGRDFRCTPSYSVQKRLLHG